jgi:hypothetical protein
MPWRTSNKEQQRRKFGGATLRQKGIGSQGAVKGCNQFQSRRPYRGEALQFTQYRFIQDRTESLRSTLRKTNLTPAQHRFWRSAAYTVLTAKTTEPNPRRQRCIEFLCQRSIESIGKRCIEPYRERIPTTFWGSYLHRAGSSIFGKGID